MRDNPIVLLASGGVDLLSSFDNIAADIQASAPSPPSDATVKSTRAWVQALIAETNGEPVDLEHGNWYLKNFTQVLATGSAFVDDANGGEHPNSLAGLLAAIGAARRASESDDPDRDMRDIDEDDDEDESLTAALDAIEARAHNEDETASLH
jgi:hypothetical protein